MISRNIILAITIAVVMVLTIPTALAAYLRGQLQTAVGSRASNQNHDPSNNCCAASYQPDVGSQRPAGIIHPRPELFPVACTIQIVWRTIRSDSPSGDSPQSPFDRLGDQPPGNTAA
jgi:hypothetical protein